MLEVPLRFAVLSDEQRGEAAFAELCAMVARGTPLRLEPVWAASHAALLAVVGAGSCDVAWAPPLVAHALVRGEGAVPVAVVSRAGCEAYYGALVVLRSSRARTVRELAGLRVGWVSRLSAAGFVVPRHHIASLGLTPERMFASETFHYSHERLAEALVRGDVDVIGTYAHVAPDGTLEVPHVPGGRIVAAAGPIPGDVIVARAGLDAGVTARLAWALARAEPNPFGPLAKLLSVERFVSVREGHLEPLSQWAMRAEGAVLRGVA
jgi:phosphonate transport system substrate-binding protein